MYKPNSFVAATNRFLKEADWLRDVDAPAVMGLRAAAKALDQELTSPLLAQYRLLFQSLQKPKPKDAEPEVDPLEELLKR